MQIDGLRFCLVLAGSAIDIDQAFLREDFSKQVRLLLPLYVGGV
jgi:hypothetical protein